ncbi:FAD-binding oxidoreductase [Mycetocola zhadangensis]|uniref:FAD-binding protein n=1 Tax=Mycetocola zhadangensis TaxID=1164595 RepID=A0A3L7J4R9_9MICO|nr:FAD-linked oxidase C-terminal domain-containing protein [Mycetocola zhadangensis]RLQ85480.1 FAD-binding protein [Mycetocola zhadangensis]GGE82955.1 FAD-linked oxidase [Mycetocola zhadangensis]
MSVVDELIAALGPAVVTDATALALTQADKSGHVSTSAPLAVVNATSIADISTTLRIASATQTPVVPRGAGTGLAGGAIAAGGEIVLSTLAMNRVLEINPADQLAVIEPGILNGRFNEILAEHGFWFAPDPASKAISTVGGNIATNAGGLLCAKYGVTRDAVLGLTVVLASGEVLELGHRSVKGVTGLDLTALFVGSEGLLGVIAGATVRIRPRVAGTVATIAAFFPTVTDAAAASAGITAAGIQPAVMEIMDAASLEAAATLLQVPGVSTGEAHLVVQTDGPAAATEAEQALAVIQSFGGRAELSTDPVEGERLLAVRRAMHPAMERLGTTLIEDVSVPRSALPAMFAEIVRIEQAYGIRIPTVAHAGDGNLHPNFVFEGTEVPDLIWRAADELFETALKLGGTLTGEHGIGILKKRWLGDELGETQLDLQRRIKTVFDPAGILNPGKVF